MADLTPLVEPLIGSTGIPINVEPSALFSQAIDEGTAVPENFFLVCVQKEGVNQDEILQHASITDIVPAEIEHRRVELLTQDDYTGKDFGIGGSAGELWRSEVLIKPTVPLKPNTNYAVIVSDRVGLISVFDPQPAGLNSGTGALEAEGPYTELITDQYTITIVSSGGKSSATYFWSRSSDGHTSNVLTASAGFMEIDRGVKVKFLAGTYDVSDSFTVRVRPQDRLSSLFSWTFATALDNFNVPEDERSNDIVNLPVLNPVANGSGVATPAFYVDKIAPDFGKCHVTVANKATARVGGIVFSTKQETNQYNGWRIEYTSGGTAGSEAVTLVGSNKIEIQVESGVSTEQQVVDAFNAEVAVNVNFVASTSTGSALVTSGAKVNLTRGNNPNQYIITFNKDVDASSLDGNLRVTTQPLHPVGEELDIYYTRTVSANVVTLTLEAS